MVQELNELIDVLNRQVTYCTAGLQTIEELRYNTAEILTFYFKYIIKK